jgi:hypothetical protein
MKFGHEISFAIGVGDLRQSPGRQVVRVAADARRSSFL